tara:strand:- start:204 stop:1175 length:972 start_codon:yes stop_codon:yes gene_type:complete
MNIIVIGGAGYIGSHVVNELIENDHCVTIFDNLSSGNKENIPENVEFILGDILNINDLENIFKNKYDIVMHFAAYKDAGESMINPFKYTENNMIGSLNILNMMDKFNIKNIIFSSSAAVYGYPLYIPLDDNHQTKPINFYGYSKLVVENLLNWYSKIKNIRYASLRYFNAAGYDIKKRIHSIEKETGNLLPIVMEVAINKRKNMEIYGNDYETKDGTCIRDYIHVNDLSSAHINAMEYIINDKKNIVCNLSTGIGYSVLEVISLAEKITGKKIDYRITNRRKGDPPILISKSNKALEILNWEPKYSSLDSILTSMWEQYKNFL